MGVGGGQWGKATGEIAEYRGGQGYGQKARGLKRKAFRNTTASRSKMGFERSP